MTYVVYISIFILIYISVNICIFQPIKSLLTNKSKKEEVLYVDELFKTIDNRIEDEVINNVKYYAMVNEKYNVMKFDEDVSKISSAVKDSLSPKIISSCPVYNGDYIMKYIIRKTSNILYSYIQSENEAE